MATNQAQQAVLEHLTTLQPWNVNGVETQDPLRVADRASVHFGRSRVEEGRYLQVVDYADLGGQTWHYVFFLREGDAGQWQVAGAGGGSGPDPIRPQPWVNLSAGWGNSGMWAGGRVVDPGVGVARVRLEGLQGLIMEDVVTEGHALLMTEQPVADLEDITAHLFDGAGRLVGRHSAFNSRQQLNV